MKKPLIISSESAKKKLESFGKNLPKSKNSDALIAFTRFLSSKIPDKISPHVFFHLYISSLQKYSRLSPNDKNSQQINDALPLSIENFIQVLINVEVVTEEIFADDFQKEIKKICAFMLESHL